MSVSGKSESGRGLPNIPSQKSGGGEIYHIQICSAHTLSGAICRNQELGVKAPLMLFRLVIPNM